MTNRRPHLPFLVAGWLCLIGAFVVPVVIALVLGGVVAGAGCADAAHSSAHSSTVCAPGGGVNAGFVAAGATTLIAVLFVGLVAAVFCTVMALRRRGDAPWLRPAALAATIVVATLPAVIAGISIATAGGAGPLNGATFAGLVGAVLTLVVGLILAAVARALERDRMPQA